MSIPSQPVPPDDLQFTTAEPASDQPVANLGGQNCVVCTRPIESTYFAVGDKLICPGCRDRLMAPPAGTKIGRLVKATVFGVAAGLVGAAIWYAIRRAAHLEIGLVAILLGWMVGKAVHRGSNFSGGLGYQILAVLITYSCIASTYAPDIVEAIIKSRREERANRRCTT